MPASQSTDRLFVPDILLHYSLHPFVLGAHILTCSYWCNSIGKGARLLGVCNKALSYGSVALAFACFCELYEVTICAPSVQTLDQKTHRLVSLLPGASCPCPTECAWLGRCRAVEDILLRIAQPSWCAIGILPRGLAKSTSRCCVVAL